jgi:Co/Zn/Cd efflux system component
MSGMGSPNSGNGDSGSAVSANEAANARAANRITVVGAVVNVGLVGVKLIAGLAAGSAALVADAVGSWDESWCLNEEERCR